MSARTRVYYPKVKGDVLHLFFLMGLSLISDLYSAALFMGKSSARHPSGKYCNHVAWDLTDETMGGSMQCLQIVTTTMANTLDILEDARLAKGVITKPKHRIRHDNQTGRWLCIYLYGPVASFYPVLKQRMLRGWQYAKARILEVLSGTSGKIMGGIQDDALMAVASRCCFDPNSEELIVVG